MLFDERVALGMNGAGVERMHAVADAEKAGGLLEGLRAEARDFLQFGARLERALLVARYATMAAAMAGLLRPET
jgi:hypothetical protein